MNRLVLVLICLLIIIGWFVLSFKASSGRVNDKLTVVTTFHPVTLLAKPIVGENVVLRQLVPSGQEVHSYHVKPSDIETLQKADVLIINGSGLEASWLDSLLKTVNRPDLLIISLSDALQTSGIPLLQLDEENTSILTTDPHVWVSPQNALVMTAAIRDGLSDVDSVNADKYRENAKLSIEVLTQLDLETQKRVDSFTQKKFVAFHDAFHYFARDYGLEQVATIELVPGQAPSPGQLSTIKQLVNRYGLRALFTEPQFSSSVVNQLAKDLKVKILTLDPLETGSDTETYPQAMRRNLDSLAQALQ